MKYGPLTNFLIFFESKDLSDFVKRLKFMYKIASLDNSLIDNIQFEKSIIELKQEKLIEEKKIFELNNIQFDAKLSELNLKKNEKEVFLIILK